MTNVVPLKLKSNTYLLTCPECESEKMQIIMGDVDDESAAASIICGSPVCDWSVMTVILMPKDEDDGE